ncbi:MAG: DUF2490 domain-containing protein [Deltaproteobacteria bacterium]|nr:DUF2490 domain-containing protein [Deltaproteobacteria bacterium]
MRRRALLLLVGAALPVTPAAAERVELWTELGVKRELAKRVDVTFDQHLRFDEDISRVSAVMPEAAIHVHASIVRASAGYRLEYERDGDGELVLRHRFHVAVRTRLELDRFRLDHRLQLQEQLRPSAMDTRRHGVRNRLEASYRGSQRWTAAASAELHHDFDRGALVADKTWLTVGAAHRRQGHPASETAGFYRLELPHHDPGAPVVHILGIAFHLDL